MKTIKGDLVLKENTIIDDNLTVEGDIRCEGRYWDLKVNGNIDCMNIDCWNIDCGDITCGDINCRDIDCLNIDCWNIDCWNINCGDLNFYAFAIAYKSFKCKSWKARRDNYVIKCLDRKIEIKDDKKYCDKCGAEIKGENKE